ncbi:zinc finger CCCH domain-containing protein 10-like [Limulus polyphemus]|uniref:Zinc finger CCCH domain-containing protein 10-like n=1 Tax=Limulus polyphemus TaxID=6850 RepID=A0ABM1BTS4_LIMPO|nr:zinc finger CCCH domain-containing protein 10-like [Limulus polyphemus]XP_013788502.1 zinc finger CCCH domain-containing protein 10-like [Limulus polyphemus]XP_022256690.1 zinc finger CCCH domain-containing protein 10-like [Limulus polyphemus]
MAENDRNGSDDICRDFLRNVCRRGSNCKYRHPEPTTETEEKGSEDIKFCRDFQNRGCRRANCKFMHCTKREEEYYLSTGKLPRLVQNALRDDKSEVPVCKDFLRGFCKRGIYCKFRHLTPGEYSMEMCGEGGAPIMGEPDNFEFEFQPKLKRPAFDDGFGPVGSGVLLPTPGPDRMSSSMSDVHILEEENIILRSKVEELKKQVTELTSTVECLLEQNAQLRANKLSYLEPSPNFRTSFPDGGQTQ